MQAGRVTPDGRDPVTEGQSPMPSTPSVPRLLPLGDRGLLVRMGDSLDLGANEKATALAFKLQARRMPGVTEIVPNLVSVLVRYDPDAIAFSTLAGEVRLLIGITDDAAPEMRTHRISVRYGGDEGPDLDTVADLLDMSPEAFVSAHHASALRVLAVGFAPGFLYCGMHPQNLVIKRRQDVRPKVPAGSVLFAAGQTAIAATPLPTGWWVIGRTGFVNFDPDESPPTRARAGDAIVFTAGR